MLNAKSFLFAALSLTVVLTPTLHWLNINAVWFEYERFLVLLWFLVIGLVLFSVIMLIDICTDIQRHFNYAHAKSMIQSAKESRNTILLESTGITVGLLISKGLFLLPFHSIPVELAIQDFRLPVFDYATFHLSLYLTAFIYGSLKAWQIQNYYSIATDKFNQLNTKRK